MSIPEGVFEGRAVTAHPAKGSTPQHEVDSSGAIPYYQHPAVRDRIREFVEEHGRSAKRAVLVRRRQAPMKTTLATPNRLWDALTLDTEIERSLWDEQGLVADLDIEYVNHDFPGEPFLDPVRTFEVQRPVSRAIQQVLLSFDIAPLHLLSGRGHHFVWFVARESRAFDQLASLGNLPSSVRRAYRGPCSLSGAAVPEFMGSAFSGLGIVLEWLAHRVRRTALRDSRIPVQLTDVRVGKGDRGRECVSIDLSEYGDPLHTRFVRTPFSRYRKPAWRPDIYGERARDLSGEMVQIPLFEMSEEQATEVMRDPELAVDLAARSSVKIPDASQGVDRLAAAYRSSHLSAFHRRYYSDPEWREFRAEIDGTIPRCAATLLERPNDLLLQPAGIQHLVRVLMSLGWPPPAIARLIESKFREDHGWDDRWRYYDPAVRADFYTRLFAGFIACGEDELIDCNSTSHQEKGFCTPPQCRCDLRVYRDSLRERVEHERLGCRPFHGLFSTH